MCQRPRQTRKGALGWGRSLSANHQRARDEARGGLRDRELGALRDSAPREESTALPKVVRGPHLGTLGAVRWFPGVLHHGLRVCCRSTRCNSDFVRVRNTPACTGAPLFFFSHPSGGGGEPLTKFPALRNFRPRTPHFLRKLVPNQDTQELGLESYSRSGFPRATRSATATEVTEGARPRNRHLARRLSGLAKGVEDRARVQSGARRLSLAARRAFLGLDRSAVSRAADDAPVLLSAQLEAFGPQGGFVYVEGVVDQGVRVGRAGRGGCWLEGEGPSAADRDDKAGQGRGPGRGEEEEEDCGGRGRRRG